MGKDFRAELVSHRRHVEIGMVGVIPTPRVLSSGARDLARSARTAWSCSFLTDRREICVQTE
jgi:hypothetical protein